MDTINNLDLLKARAGCYESISLATEDVFIALGMIANLQQRIKTLKSQVSVDLQCIRMSGEERRAAEAKNEHLLSTVVELWGFAKPHPDFKEYDSDKKIYKMVEQTLKGGE